MASASENASAGTAALSARETHILVAAVLSMSLEEIKLDMDKFVKFSGFANANSARVQWYGVKKKVLGMASEDGLTLPTATSTPRKRKPKAATGNEEEAAEGITPTKKLKTPTKAKAPAPVKDEDKEKPEMTDSVGGEEDEKET